MPGGSTPLSLKGRALLWLSQREHSRAELRRKLLNLQRLRSAEAAAGTGASGAALEAEEATPTVGLCAGDISDTRCVSPVCVEHLLDWLERQGLLSNERFIESRLRQRAARYGNRRLEGELAQHGLVADDEQRSRLKESELARAQALWSRRFGALPADLSERARQTRFLVQRGFSADTVRRVLAGAAEDDAAP